MLSSKDRVFSQKSKRPRCTPSSVSGLSAGISIGGKKGGISNGYGVAVGLQSGPSQFGSWQRSHPIRHVNSSSHVIDSLTDVYRVLSITRAIYRMVQASTMRSMSRPPKVVPSLLWVTGSRTMSMLSASPISTLEASKTSSVVVKFCLRI